MTREQIRKKMHEYVDSWVNGLPPNGLFAPNIMTQCDPPDGGYPKIEYIHLAELTCETHKKGESDEER